MAAATTTVMKTKAATATATAQAAAKGGAGRLLCRRPEGWQGCPYWYACPSAFECCLEWWCRKQRSGHESDGRMSEKRRRT